LKYFVTILLIGVVALQTFSKWFVILDYRINEEYIAKNLCENRNKSKSCCHGKCYLGKQLAKEEDQQQTPAKGGQREETQTIWYLLNNTQAEFHLFGLLKSNYPLYLTGKSQEFARSFFQPPQA
jgi:hypothetical protein